MDNKKKTQRNNKGKSETDAAQQTESESDGNSQAGGDGRKNTTRAARKKKPENIELRPGAQDRLNRVNIKELWASEKKANYENFHIRCADCKVRFDGTTSEMALRKLKIHVSEVQCESRAAGSRPEEETTTANIGVQIFLEKTTRHHRTTFTMLQQMQDMNLTTEAMKTIWDAQASQQRDRRITRGS
jgi:type III secretory pathway component EscV